MLEFPAGKIDSGRRRRSRPRSGNCARRPATSADAWQRMGTIHPEVGYSTEAIDVVPWPPASRHVGAQLDEGEFLDVVSMTEGELLAAFDTGEVTDSKTVAALFTWTRFHARRDMTMKARRLAIRGRVQGAWLPRRCGAGRVRYSASCGWVRNRRDGSVEALVQGEPRASRALRRVVPARGPPLAARRRRHASADAAGGHRRSKRFESRLTD